MTAWFKALQEWNKGRSKYEIPKKGSKGYKEVMLLADKYKKTGQK